MTNDWLTDFLADWLNHLLTRWLTHTLTHARSHSLIHSLINSLTLHTHSLTQSLTHSVQRLTVYLIKRLISVVDLGEVENFNKNKLKKVEVKEKNKLPTKEGGLWFAAGSIGNRVIWLLGQMYNYM